MGEAKFAVDQKVKFINDHDRMTGKVTEIHWNSKDGFIYHITSRYYDVELHDMVEGKKICKEDELVDMTNYDGTTKPIVPNTEIKLEEKIAETQSQTTEGQAQ